MALLFFLELLVLFFLSRLLTTELSLLFHRIFRSQKVTIFLIAFIFLPGTIIHELSHAIMAKLLFVYVGKMELMPEINGNSLKLGSVQVGKTDLFRNFFIGIAPFITGTGLLLFILFQSFSRNIIGLNVLTILIMYLVFVLANTMYSSKKDMEGAVEFFLLVLIPIGVLYYFGVRIPGLNLGYLNSKEINHYFTQGVIFLVVPIIIDFAIIIFGRIINRR